MDDRCFQRKVRLDTSIYLTADSVLHLHRQLHSNWVDCFGFCCAVAAEWFNLESEFVATLQRLLHDLK